MFQTESAGKRQKRVYGDDMSKNKIKRSKWDICFENTITVILIVLGLAMVYPILYVIFASLSDAEAFVRFTGFLSHPLGFTTLAYKMAFKNPMILRGYLNTIVIVVGGVTVNILLTSIGAYFLSRKNVKLQAPIMVMIVVSMFFSGGTIPFYFTVKQLGIMDTPWALILPVAVNTFNLIIMRTSFASLPDSLEESASVEGAGHLTILFRIVLPVSKAVLAVMILYYTVQHWNAWFNAMLFMNTREKFPLQLILREVLIQEDTSSMVMGVSDNAKNYVSETIKYAVVVIATLPILCIYPFLQKYFAQGVMIGAVKG